MEVDTTLIEKTVESVKWLIKDFTERAKAEKAAGFNDKAEETLRKVAFNEDYLAQIYAQNPWLEREVHLLSAAQPPVSAAQFSPAGVQLPVSMAQPPLAATKPAVAQAIVLSALIIAGAALLCVVLVTGANGYYAEMLFALVAYLIWQHYL